MATLVNLNVVRTTTLVTDLDNDGLADPGDTLQTSVTITNTGSVDALGVTINDVLKLMTQTGGVTITPIAFDDSLPSIVGNTPVTFSAAQLLGNDVDPNGSQAALSVVSVGAATNGTIVDNGNGTYTFTPTTGFTGTASFTYSVRDAEGLTSNVNAKASFTVTDGVWYVDSAGQAGGDGSFGHAFQTVGAAVAAAAANGRDANGAANDTIFVYDRGGTYTQASGITLASGEKLLGDGSSLTSVNGNAVGASNSNSAFTVTGGSTTAVTLNANNTLAGLNITASGNGATAVSGTVGGGTTHFTDVAVTGTANALVLNGGGTVDATGVNTLSASAGVALNVTNTTIGAAGLTFRSIGSSGSGSSGIILNNTGTSGGLTVTGTGGANTGGTIQSASGDGVSLNNTMDVHLAGMRIIGNRGDGIGGGNVNGLVLDTLTISGNGDDAATDESGINLSNLTGTGSGGAHATLIRNSTISNNNEFEVQITNTAGTLTNLQFVNNTISADGAAINGNATSPHGNLVNILGQGSATMGVSVSGGTFTGNTVSDATHVITGTGIFINAGGTSTTASVKNATFTNNNVGVDISTDPVATTLTFEVFGNTITGSRGNAINHFDNGNGPFNRTVNGTIQGNVIGGTAANSGSQLGYGISIQNEGAVNGNFLIDNNIIRNIQQFAAISVNVGLGGVATGGGTTNVTMTANSISNIGSRAIQINDNQSVGVGPGPTINASVYNNNFFNISGQAGNGQYLRFRELGGSVNVFQQSATNTSNQFEIDDANFFNDPLKVNVSGGVSFGQIAPPTRPTSPSLPMQVQPPQHGAVPAVGGEAAAPAAADMSAAHALTQGALDQLVTAAIAQWAAAGATPEQLAAMRAVRFTIEDMAGQYVGLATGGHVTIDADAAGHGWFVDGTPADSAEFAQTDDGLYATATGGAAGRIDALTVVAHELGHQIGIGDSYVVADHNSLMYGYADIGVRRGPSAADLTQATGAAPTFDAYAIAPVSIGTLPAGKSVTVTYTGVVNSFSNQVIPTGADATSTAIVSGSNFVTVSSNGELLVVDSLTLGNLVFNDVNRNGVYDAGDSGVSGVTLTLYADANGNGTLDGNETTTVLATTTTNGSGNYSFTNLAPGDYVVVIDATNFTGGGALVGKLGVYPGATDPDDNANNDNNGSIAGGAVYSAPIRLDYDSEPGGNVNNTLDFGVFAPNQAPTVDLDPVAGGTGASINYTENAGAVDVAGSATVADGDSADFVGGSLTITITANGAVEDQLAIDTSDGVFAISGGSLTHNGAIIGTVSGGGLGTPIAITFNDASRNGVAGYASPTAAIVQSLYQHVTYTNASDDPSSAARTIEFTLVDGDGSLSGGSDTSTTTATINVIAVNDAPTASATGIDPTFTENGTAVQVFSAAAFSPVEASQSLTLLTLTISNVDEGKDTLTFASGVSLVLSDGASADLGAVDASVIVSGGTASVIFSSNGVSGTALANLITGMTFANTSEDPAAGSRLFTITSVQDNGGTLNNGNNTVTPTLTSTVTVVAVDDPAVAKNDGFSTDEATAIGSGLSLFDNNGNGADSDVDGPALSIAQVNGNAANVGTQITLASGALLTVNVDGTFAYDPNGAFDDLTGLPGGVNSDGTDSFTYTLAGGGTATVRIAIAGLGNDPLYGNAGDNTLNGDGSDNTIDGRGGDDVLSGNGGDDVLIGGAGADRIDGGAGMDTASFATSSGGVVVNLTSGRGSGGDATGDIYTSIERLVGGGGDDTLSSNQRTDSLAGGGGDDRLIVGDSVPHLDGGSGTDRLYVRQTAGVTHFVDGQISNVEIVIGYDGSRIDLSGIGTAFDRIKSASTANGVGAEIHGTSGDDVILGGRGHDTLDGGVGDDRIILYGAPTAVDGGAGTSDVLVVRDGTFALSDAQFDGFENVVLMGGTNVDFSAASEAVTISLRGATGERVSVVGTAGENRIYGGAGNDTIDGGGGADGLSGGAGRDTFHFSSLANMQGANAVDRILDLSKADGDRIDLRDLDADTTLAGQQQFTFIGTNAFSGDDNSYEARVKVIDATTSYVQFDVDHDGKADYSFLVKADAPLTDPGIILI